MPSNEPFPIACIAAGFDAAPYKGGPVVSINGNNITLAAQDLFDDLPTHLNGRGRSGDNHVGDDPSVAVPAGQIMAAKTGVDNWWWYIDVDDKMVIETDGAAFSVTATFPAGNAIWGFDAAGQASVLVGAIHRVTANGDWKRGNVGLDGVSPVIEINPSATAVFSCPIAARGLIYQDLVTALRREDEGDADQLALAASLEYLGDAAAADDGHWLMGDDGHVIYATPNGVAFAPTWLASPGVEYSHHLGFDGSETMATVLATNYWRASERARGWERLVWPLRRLEPTERNDSSLSRLATGEPIGATTSQWREWSATFWIFGPAQQNRDSSASWLDLVRLCPPASMLTIYPEWGDPRRREIDRTWTEYSKLRNKELNGRRGRIRGRRSEADGDQSWVPEGDLLDRAEVTIIIDELP